MVGDVEADQPGVGRAGVFVEIALKALPGCLGLLQAALQVAQGAVGGSELFAACGGGMQVGNGKLGVARFCALAAGFAAKVQQLGQAGLAGQHAVEQHQRFVETATFEFIVQQGGAHRGDAPCVLGRPQFAAFAGGGISQCAAAFCRRWVGRKHGAAGGRVGGRVGSQFST